MPKLRCYSLQDLSLKDFSDKHNYLSSYEKNQRHRDKDDK